MADSLSIDEANKIRVAMGMAPLPGGSSSGPVFKKAQGSDSDDSSDDEEPASTLETRAAAGFDNWKKLEEERKAKEKREKQKADIKRAREIAQRNVKLEGKGLADEDDDISATAWLKGSKKRQKEIEKARRIERELAERERELQAEYTSKDLAGLKVGHEVDAFEGGDQVLTLKDTEVGADSEEDELENVDLRDKERLDARLESKKRKRAYDPNDVDINGQKSILGQYDEEIEGKKRKLFTLDGEGRTVESTAAADIEHASKPKGLIFSLDLLEESKPASDYLDISEIKVKKPKKKSKKSSRKKTEDDDIFPVNGSSANNGAMELDQPTANGTSGPKKSKTEDNFVDDDDLQAQIAAQRRQALKKRKKMRPEDIAQQMREEEANAMDVVDSVEAEGGMILDETSEFLTNLQNPSVPMERRRQKSSQPKTAQAATVTSPDADEEGDTAMQNGEQSYGALEDAEEKATRTERAASHEVTATGLEEESSLSQGLGATLRLARDRGLVKDSRGDDLNTQYRERQKFLQDKQKAEQQSHLRALEQRERDRASGKLDHLSAREREDWARQSNNYREQAESRKIAEIFNKEYKPNIELKYVDEHGRRMNEKEAFKHLSHQFHGKGSGKQKTEKRLKKVEDEKKMMAASVLDASQKQGYDRATEETSRLRKTAGVRLQ